MKKLRKGDMRVTLYLLMAVILVIQTMCTPKSEQAMLAQKSQGQPNREERKVEAIQGPSVRKSNTQGDLASLFKENRSAAFIITTSDGVNGKQGSGFFVSSNGVGISNYHVFEGTLQGYEEIVLIDGSRHKISQVLEKNEDNDYIIFKVNSNRSLNYLTVASFLPEVGEDVFAIGNPHGLEHTLSTGIVSGYRENNKYIQTTTEITHGSSGGPLLNMRGEVIGITTMGFGEANLNFAINIRVLGLQEYLR